MDSIGLFVPYRFVKKPIYENQISRIFGHKANYVSKGRYAITHILKSHGITSGQIAISSYMCPSVRETLIQQGYSVVYYDIDEKDLNPSIASVQEVINSIGPKALVVASMYGNPADLEQLELLCKEKKIVMIDDAAQSFGARLGNRYVGSYGNGGFFSFSPGKPTAAHRGGYFWTDEDYVIERTRHILNAVVTYKDFKYNRYLVYKKHPINKLLWHLIAKGLSCISINTENDKMEHFESYILGGVFDSNFNEAITYRHYWSEKFAYIKLPENCRLIMAVRGIPNNCKIVYVFADKRAKEAFSDYLRSKRISYFGGYNIPDDVADSLYIAKKVEGKIVELPIDYDEKKMKYLYDCVRRYFNKVGENS